MSQPRLHLAYVDGLRLLLALWVVVGHMYGNFSGASPRMPFPLYVLLFSPHLAVSVFIVVSGFCLTLPAARRWNEERPQESPWRFLARRARRILPPYYATLLLTLALLATGLMTTPQGAPRTGFDPGLPVLPTDLLSYLTLTQDVYALGRLCGQLWSVAVEWRIYLLFPLVVGTLALLRRSRGAGSRQVPALLLALAFALIAGEQAFWMALPALPTSAQVWLGHPADWFEPAPQVVMTPVAWLAPSQGLALVYVALFLLGMLAALAATLAAPWAAAARAWPGWAALGLTLLALCFGLDLWGFHVWGGEFGLTSPERWLGLDALIGMSGACLLLAGTLQRGGGWVRTLLGWRPLATLGAASYSVYLVHLPLLQLLTLYVSRPLSNGGADPLRAFVVDLVALPPLLGLCWLFHLAVERPFMRSRAT